MTDLKTAPDHAREILDELGITDERHREKAVAVAERHVGDLGSIPRSFGAGAVYLAGTVIPGGQLTQREVAKAADLSTASVAKAFRTLRQDEFPDNREGAEE